MAESRNTPVPESRPDDGKHREWFWNGTRLVLTILAVLFWGLLFVVAWVFYAVWIFRAPWFRAESRDQRFVFKGMIATGMGVVFFLAWSFSPRHPIAKVLEKLRDSTPSQTVTVTAAPVPLPASPSPSPSIQRPRSKKLTAAEQREQDRILRDLDYQKPEGSKDDN
jgi:hypothetical protein